MIEAAGGAVWRTTGLHIEVLLVHRPRQHDWSLPKGKLERGESHLEAALREVLEETGLRCSASAELPESRYRDRSGRLKRVRYWQMEPISGEFRANREVDKIRWIRLDRIATLATYDRDLAVVAGLERLIPSTVA
jgi:8-oxo-dGTP pyrophosphatase MutT (NUDIX family)